MNTEHYPRPQNLENDLVRLYWVMRIGIAFIWFWTAIVSWFIYPQAESLDWLPRLGFTNQTNFLFSCACLLDLVMGIASSVFASRWIWHLQFAIIAAYSLAIVIGLPEFLLHPFGPITKNIAVLACLAYLGIIEKRRHKNSDGERQNISL